MYIYMLLAREKFWMAELNTLFPYGLNMEANFNKIQDAYKIIMANNSNQTIYEVFNKEPSKRTSTGAANGVVTAAVDTTNFEVSIWIDKTVSDSSTCSNMIHSIRTTLFSMKYKFIKKIYIECCNRIQMQHNVEHNKHQYIIYVIKDLCLFKLRTVAPKNKSPNSFIVVKFVNKLIENVKLDKIFKYSYINNLFPVKNSHFSKPVTSYSRTNSIRSKIVNYKQTIQDPDYQDFTCHCGEYQHLVAKDIHHGHIVTGNLKLIENAELHKLVSKGLNFHEQQPPDINKAYLSIKSGLDSYISKITDKLHLPLCQFTGWKNTILEHVEKKLRHSKQYKFNNVLSKRSNAVDLENLQKNFVFVPVDKASNNVGIICKKYYMGIISNEIEESNTFTKLNTSENDIFKDLSKSTYIKKNDNRKLPTLYATIKMHKNPIGFRFITAGRDTIVQNLSTSVSKCLKLLLNVAKTSAKYKIANLDNSVFIIDNRNKVIKYITEVNAIPGNGRKSVSAWDFSTLYTSIPHDQLKKCIESFIRKVFDKCVLTNKDPKAFICSSGKRDIGYFSKNPSKINPCYNLDELINAINFVIDNSLIKFHDMIFRQTIGIPMGTNCAPFLANVYLHVYEYLYLETLVKNNDLGTAQAICNNMFRYQDDCLTVNDSGIFKDHCDKIYPPEMILKNTNISRDKCTFLDLTISIYRGKLLYYSYDKRDDFGFEVVNYPNLLGNIPSKQSYGVYISQLVRYCDINSNYKHFASDIKSMNDRFLAQGFEKKQLFRKYMDFCDKFLYKWSKFNIDIQSSEFYSTIFKFRSL